MKNSISYLNRFKGLDKQFKCTWCNSVSSPIRCYCVRVSCCYCVHEGKGENWFYFIDCTVGRLNEDWCKWIASKKKKKYYKQYLNESQLGKVFQIEWANNKCCIVDFFSRSNFFADVDLLLRLVAKIIHGLQQCLKF